ncbi:MAG: exopolysaccharide biosynthesis polyprenyl glycosylphosphotransferase [Patescibacteria group bacterium]
MLKTRSKRLILLVGDVFILYISLGLMLFLRYNLALFADDKRTVLDAWNLHKTPFLLIYTVWIIIFYGAGMYDWERFAPRRINLIKLIFQTMTIGASVAVLLFYFLPIFKITPKTNLIINAIIAAILLSIWRIVFLKTISRGSKIKVLFFGNTAEGSKFKDRLNNSPSLGYHVDAVIDHTNSAYMDLKKLILEQKIDLIIIVQDISQNQELLKIFYEAIPLGITIIDFSEFYEMVMGKVPVSVINESWFLENLFELNKRTFEVAKRLLDILASIILGIPLLLLFPLIACAIFISTPDDIRNYKERRARKGDGIIFFRQERVGKNGKVFNFIKFRSQRLGAEKISRTVGEKKEIEKDARRYFFGQLLRKTYLDELPQILNILRGEMSLVGPRPERPEYVNKLKENIKFYEIRHLVRPGITGWAQINMQNDASVDDAPEKLQYDLYYIKNRSILTDIAIMIKTASILISRSGR